MEGKAVGSVRGPPRTSPAYLGAPTMRGASVRGARSRSSSMVAPIEIPQLTPRRPSASASVKHEDDRSSSSSRSSSVSSSRSLSEERPVAPTDRTSSYEDPGAPRGPPPPYGSSNVTSRDLPLKAAAAATAATASGGDVLKSPRPSPEKTSESWRQLAPGGPPPPPGWPGAPPQGGGPPGPPLNIVVSPDTGPGGGPLYPPPRLSEAWRTSGEGGRGPPSARGSRGPSPLGARSPRASMGLPAVPQSPRGSVLLTRGDSGSGRAGGVGGVGGPSFAGGPKADGEKGGAPQGKGGCLLQQAAAAGLRGVPCPNCRYVVPLQHIVLCAEWQIRHAVQTSRPPPPAPNEPPPQGAPLGAPPGGMRLSPTSLQQQQLSKPFKLAAAAASAAADTPGWGYYENQQQQQQSGYDGSWRGPSMSLPWGPPTRPFPVRGGPPPEAPSLAYGLGPGATNARGPPMGGSVWGPVPPSFLSSPFNMHLWAA